MYWTWCRKQKPVHEQMTYVHATVYSKIRHIVLHNTVDCLLFYSNNIMWRIISASTLIPANRLLFLFRLIWQRSCFRHVFVFSGHHFKWIQCIKKTLAITSSNHMCRQTNKDLHPEVELLNSIYTVFTTFLVSSFQGRQISFFFIIHSQISKMWKTCSREKNFAFVNKTLNRSFTTDTFKWKKILF